MAKYVKIGLLEERIANNGDRITLTRVPKTHTMWGDNPAHLVLLINGNPIAEPRTEVEARRMFTELVWARQHGF